MARMPTSTAQPIAPPDEIIEQHDLLLERGVYLVDDPASYQYAFLLVTSTGKIAVRKLSKLEYEARASRFDGELYAALCQLEPEPSPALVRDLHRPTGNSLARIHKEFGAVHAG
jgi:hypothetical protein